MQTAKSSYLEQKKHSWSVYCNHDGIQLRRTQYRHVTNVSILDLKSKHGSAQKKSNGALLECLGTAVRVMIAL